MKKLVFFVFIFALVVSSCSKMEVTDRDVQLINAAIAQQYKDSCLEQVKQKINAVAKAGQSQTKLKARLTEYAQHFRFGYQYGEDIPLTDLVNMGATSLSFDIEAFTADANITTNKQLLDLWGKSYETTVDSIQAAAKAVFDKDMTVDQTIAYTRNYLDSCIEAGRNISGVSQANMAVSFTPYATNDVPEDEIISASFELLVASKYSDPTVTDKLFNDCHAFYEVLANWFVYRVLSKAKKAPQLYRYAGLKDKIYLELDNGNAYDASFDKDSTVNLVKTSKNTELKSEEYTYYNKEKK